MRQMDIRNRGYILAAAALGAIGGGVIVIFATRAIPRMVSRLISQIMQNMMSQM
jgi:hypothetical protein